MGDLVLVIDNDTIKSGIDRNSIVVMDVEDKITCLSEIDNSENKLSVILRTMKNLIGEYSNYSSAYHNKVPIPEVKCSKCGFEGKGKLAEGLYNVYICRNCKSTVEPTGCSQKEIYNNYIAIIATLTGKAIDFSKTGIMYHMPKHISKYGRPLPYFMKYRDDYYRNQKLSKTYSNMNRVCYKIEDWEKEFRWKRTYSDFDYNIMIDNTINVDESTYTQIEKLFIEFCNEMVELAKDQREIRLTTRDFVIDWNYYYTQYKKKCNAISKDQKLIANIAVHLSYVKYPKKNKKFMWCIASEGIIKNLEQKPVLLPAKCENGNLTYLGKKYVLVKEGKGEIEID